MWTDLVVIDPPRLTFYPSVVQAQEPKSVEAFCSDTAVEGLGKGVVSRLARTAEVEDDTVGPGPQIQILRDKFWPIIQAYSLRPPMGGRNPIKGSYYVCATIAHPNIERWRHPAEVVDDGQHTDFAAVEQLV